MQECQFPRVPVRKFSLGSNCGDFRSPPLVLHMKENGWSRSAEASEPVLSGSEWINTNDSPLAVCALSLTGVGEQVESVDAASRPQAAGRRKGVHRSAFALSVPICDLTMCW